MSGVAVASLVSSLILCCPVTTVVGMILGVVGYFSTGAGKRRGRGLAIAGFLIGVVTTAGWIGGGMFAWNAGMKVVLSGAELVMTEPSTTGRTYFVAGEEPTAEAIDAFTDEAEARYGTFVSAAVNEEADAQPGQQSFELPFEFEFANEKRTALVSFEAIDESNPTTTISGSYVGIVKIVIQDSDNGDLLLQGAPPATAP